MMPLPRPAGFAYGAIGVVRRAAACALRHGETAATSRWPAFRRLLRLSPKLAQFGIRPSNERAIRCGLSRIPRDRVEHRASNRLRAVILCLRYSRSLLLQEFTTTTDRLETRANKGSDLTTTRETTREQSGQRGVGGNRRKKTNRERLVL